MILIADAHVDEQYGNDAEFFEMLAAFEACDREFVFMGDIFQLWIALPGYERPIHRRFLSWCRSRQRPVGFVEGNHEFFVAEERKPFFSWCTSTGWSDRRGIFFCHGDRVNPADRVYLGFRKLTKNPFTKAVTRRFPKGPILTEQVKRMLERTRRPRRIRLPKKEIDAFARKVLDAKVHTVFMAHFHCAYQYAAPDGGRLHVLPGWYRTGRVALYDRSSGDVSVHHWRRLAADCVLQRGAES